MEGVIGPSSFIPDFSIDDLKEVLRRPSGISLVIANLMVFLAAIFFGWDLGAVLVLYWAESLVIGFFTLLKLVLAKTNSFLKIFIIPFFIVHFSGFMLVHIAFIGFFYFQLSLSSGKTIEGAILDFIISVLLGLLIFFVSHGISFYTNYIERKESKEENLVKIMFSPYPRIVVMHVSIFVVFFSVFFFVITVPIFSVILSFVGLLLLTSFKTLLDLAAHAKERKRFGSL